MQRIKVIVSALILLISPFLSAYQSYAINSSIVIGQIVAGTTNPSAPTQEFISLYNNSGVDVDITNWCVTNKSSAAFACVTAAANIKIYVHPHSYVKIASQSFVAANPGQYDVIFPVANQSSGSITLTDTIAVLDAVGQSIDSTTLPSGFASGNVWQRNASSPNGLQDTDTPADFTRVTAGLDMPTSGTYEVETVVDVCPNIVGAQATVPNGQIIDTAGNCITPPPIDMCSNMDGPQSEVPPGMASNGQGECYVDACSNIAGLQTTVPDGYDVDAAHACTQHDECTNVAGVQPTVPDGYKKSGDACVLDLLPLQLTEIVPNPAGSDTGREYIELYNPTDRVADLGLYILYVGVNNEKSYAFPAGSMLQPGEYAVFHDSDMKFTLVNSAGKVSLAGSDGTMIAASDAYANPGDDEAWALIDGSWQYTTQPTPGAGNIASPIETEESESAEGPAPCPAGKYRNPLTNRCRNIESDAAVLAACAEDQYRNPETGRCRKVVTAGALTLCKDGQYRSEETNRCRNSTTSSASLTPCKEGQERNPDTNRCRNAAAKSVPDAAFAVQPTKSGASSFVGWWALAGVAALALGYAVWEWRFEVLKFIRSIKPPVRPK